MPGNLGDEALGASPKLRAAQASRASSQGKRAFANLATFGGNWAKFKVDLQAGSWHQYSIQLLYAIYRPRHKPHTVAVS